MMESQIAVIFPCACSLPVTFPTARVLHLHTAVPAASSFFDVSCVLFHTPLFLKKRFCVFIFRERGRGGKKCGCLSHAQYWRTWPATQACAWTGNWTGNPFGSQPMLNPLSYTSQGSITRFLERRDCIFIPTPSTLHSIWFLVILIERMYKWKNKRTNEALYL